MSSSSVFFLCLLCSSCFHFCVCYRFCVCLLLQVAATFRRDHASETNNHSVHSTQEKTRPKKSCCSQFLSEKEETVSLLSFFGRDDYWKLNTGDATASRPVTKRQRSEKDLFLGKRKRPLHIAACGAGYAWRATTLFRPDK